MKSRFKETVKGLTVIFLILFTIYLAYSHPSNWQAIAIVAAVLIVVVQLFYKPFHIISIDGKYGIEFDGSSNKADLSKEVKSLQEKLSSLDEQISKASSRISNDKLDDIQKQINSLSEEISKKQDKPKEIRLTPMQMLNQYYVANNLDLFDPEEDEPIDVDDFHDLVQWAKKGNESYDHNRYYTIIVDKYSKAYTVKMLADVKQDCNEETFEKQKPILLQAIRRPYSKETLLSIRDSLITPANKSKLMLKFDQLMNNLDWIQL
ncbi:hypothetical protein [Limosilactobacillus urinaemulieris]|uniref:coiled-coil domain-containing protein n=1 Tax=Limosilactobacillus urinaemulieris TaxID=2742600 RepID=UPI0028EA79E2|nr:hypothetical protein [Limosilactobacillus urinaemulieris]